MSPMGSEPVSHAALRGTVPGRTEAVGRWVAGVLGLLLLAQTGRAGVVAADDADNDPYPVTNFQPGDNGGFGFNAWRILESGTPGARFITATIDGGRHSWGLSGTYALGRGLVTPLAAGTWRVTALHDGDNRTFSGFNLKTSTQPGLASGELLRFGLNPQVANYDGGGIHVSTNGGSTWSYLDCGWIGGPGDTLEYAVTWNSTGAWWLTVSNLDENAAAKFAGAMWPGAVAMLGVAACGAGLGEGLTFDAFYVTSEDATRPRLSIRWNTATTVVVSWPPPALGWYLQQNVSLATTNWADVAQAPQLVPDGWQVVLPGSTPTALFFRLRK